MMPHVTIPAARWGMFLLLLSAVAACSSDPIGPVSDFDFIFEEIQEVDLGEAPDTSAIGVDFEPVPEDTAYMAVQSRFVADARSAPQSGSVPQAIVSVSEDVNVAFDAATADRLVELASLNPSALVANVYAGLDDPGSGMETFAGHLEEQSARYPALAVLLGLSGDVSSSVMRRRPERPDLESIPYSIASACETDARVQTEDQIDVLTLEKERRAAALERARAQSIEAANTFRDDETRKLTSLVDRRKREAEAYFEDAEDAVTTLIQNGLINQGTASNLRLAVTAVVVSRMHKTRAYGGLTLASIQAAVEAAIAAADARYEMQSMQLETSYKTALLTVGQLESEAIQDCHDQGGSTG